MPNPSNLIKYQFRPGHAPTPGAGRPKLPLALKKALPEACDELIALCKDPDPAIRLRASERVIAWNIGQPGVAWAEDEPVLGSRREVMIAALEVIKAEAPDLLEVEK